MTSDRTTSLAIARGTGKHAKAALRIRQAETRAALERETGKSPAKPSLWDTLRNTWTEMSA